MLLGFAIELRARRQSIKSAWERRLRCEPVTSPLANPDTISLMMDRSLDQLFDAIELSAKGGVPPKTPGKRDRLGCLCGLNPLLAYFRAFAGTLCSIAGGTEKPLGSIDPVSASQCLDEALLILRDIAQRDIAAFCSVCQTEISAGQRHSMKKSAVH